MNVINDLVLYTLTEEENKEFERKVNLLEDFCKTFNKRFYFRNIIEAFTVKEILSSNIGESKLCTMCDLPRSVLQRVKVVSYDVNKYLAKAVENGIFDESKLKNLRSDILDCSKDSLCIEESEFFNMFGRGQDTLNDILNKDKTHLFNSSRIQDMIDNVVSNYDYDEDFADKVLKAYPDYTGFILAIINDNITKDRKLAILKKSFRQKDFNAYIEMFGAKLKNYDDLDLFIETVITNNNRIKNKDNNLWNVFKRVFIGKKGRNSSYPSTNMNKDAFFKKYSQILTPDKLIDFVEEMYTDYYLRNNLEALIRDLYKDRSLDDKISYAIQCGYFSVLFSNDLSKLFIENDNPKTRNLLINYYNSRRNNKSNLGEMADTFGVNFVDYINANFTGDEYDISFLDIDTHINSDRMKYYVRLSDELFSKINFYKKNRASSLFIEDRCDYGSKDRTSRVMSSLAYLLGHSNDAKRETIYSKIFNVFFIPTSFLIINILFQIFYA